MTARQPVCGAPPRPTARPAAGWIRLRLPYTPPYDFAGLLAFLRDRAIDGVESVGDGVYARPSR